MTGDRLLGFLALLPCAPGMVMQPMSPGLVGRRQPRGHQGGDVSQDVA